MNPNLPRWMFSSLANHFAELTEDIDGLKYHVQGVDEPKTENFQNDSALFMMDGPIANEGSNGVEWYVVDLCILLTDIVQSRDIAYDIHSWAGIYQANMLNEPMQIFKLGDGPEDDDTLIGCLTPATDRRNNVWVHNYGQVDKDLRVKQVSINGRFYLYC